MLDDAFAEQREGFKQKIGYEHLKASLPNSHYLWPNWDDLLGQLHTVGGQALEVKPLSKSLSASGFSYTLVLKGGEANVELRVLAMFEQNYPSLDFVVANLSAVSTLQVHMELANNGIGHAYFHAEKPSSRRFATMIFHNVIIRLNVASGDGDAAFFLQQIADQMKSLTPSSFTAVADIPASLSPPAPKAGEIFAAAVDIDGQRYQVVVDRGALPAGLNYKGNLRFQAEAPGHYALPLLVGEVKTLKAGRFMLEVDVGPGE